MRAPRLAPAALRRLALVNIVLLVAIIVSGAIVRLSRSGLGCADWPNCSEANFVDISDKHSAIEQLNRIFSGLLGIPLFLGVLLSYWRTPRRRDLVRLSWLLFFVFWMNAVVGGISVMIELAWFSVTLHFLLAVSAVCVALIVRQRASESEGPYRPLVSSSVMLLARVVYGLTIVVLLLGTLVTAAGPHGGDDAASRLNWNLGEIARVHGIVVDVLVVLTLVLAIALVRTGAPHAARLWVSLTIVAMIAQGILGYTQYFNEIPAVLVGFHVFGATVVFITVQQLLLVLRAPVASDAPAARVPAGAVAVATR
jgi:cytochrome c oxidase assembly protein subunit 15